MKTQRRGRKAWLKLFKHYKNLSFWQSAGGRGEESKSYIIQSTTVANVKQIKRISHSHSHGQRPKSAEAADTKVLSASFHDPQSLG